MQDLKASILIVEDEETVRSSLAEILKVLGHRVRCAADGLAALVEINEEVPEILLSDLNMPGMSGFELLPLVRIQFPIVRVIAMSGAFCGCQVPDGVTADAFYAKGNGVAVLMKAIESLPFANRRGCKAEAPEPIWIQRSGDEAKATEFAAVAGRIDG
ncbi:MAG: response regulator [Terracidiphilus sp.]|jgi:CheY-like chemotaxis protein